VTTVEDYSRVEHLKMIQGVISRLGQNSFVLKGWSVTLTAGLLAAAINDKGVYAKLALFPTIVFWGLDAYYLQQERLFRALHNAVANEEGASTPRYSLDVTPHRGSVDSWLCACVAPTVLVLHATVALVVGMVILASGMR
jgi:hypothetical protein